MLLPKRIGIWHTRQSRTDSANYVRIEQEVPGADLVQTQCRYG